MSQWTLFVWSLRTLYTSSAGNSNSLSSRIQSELLIFNWDNLTLKKKKKRKVQKCLISPRKISQKDHLDLNDFYMKKKAPKPIKMVEILVSLVKLFSAK